MYTDLQNLDNFEKRVRGHHKLAWKLSTEDKPLATLNFI